MKKIEQLCDYPLIFRVISEPGDATRYDYIVVVDHDEYMFAQYKSTFPFPRRLNFFDVVSLPVDIEDGKFVAMNSDSEIELELYEDLGRLAHEERVNIYTLAECIRTILHIRGKQE